MPGNQAMRMASQHTFGVACLPPPPTLCRTRCHPTKLGAVDPTLYLSIYLLIYPVLQWGIGSVLLRKEEAPRPASGEPCPSGGPLTPVSLSKTLSTMRA